MSIAATSCAATSGARLTQFWAKRRGKKSRPVLTQRRPCTPPQDGKPSGAVAYGTESGMGGSMAALYTARVTRR
jgi:hypothetical protein